MYRIKKLSLKKFVVQIFLRKFLAAYLLIFRKFIIFGNYFFIIFIYISGLSINYKYKIYGFLIISNIF